MNGDQLFWVIVATAVTVVLKWASNRWPGPENSPRRKRRRRLEEQEEDT